MRRFLFGRTEEEEVLRWDQPMSQAQTDRLADRQTKKGRQRKKCGRHPGRAHLLLAIKLRAKMGQGA